MLAQLRIFTIALWVLLFTVSAGNCQNQNVSYPATGSWNGYNAHINVLECLNFNRVDVSLGTIIKDSQGDQLGSAGILLPAFGVKHLILGDIAPLTDRYGSILLTLSPATSEVGSNVRCYTSIYRFNSIDSRLEYAFTLPVTDSLVGERSGIFNSYHPKARSTPILNWLSIMNPGDSLFSAEVRVRDQAGVLEKVVPVLDIPPGGRRDIALGHDSVEEQGQTTGLYQIVPAEGAGAYQAFLTRYGRGEERGFTFAFPLSPQEGRCDTELQFSSTMNPADNWIELGNTSDKAGEVFIEFFDSAGTKLGVRSVTFSPYEQKHVYVNEFLGSSRVGTTKLSCDSDSGFKFVAQSLFYGLDTQNQLLWAYGSQSLFQTTASAKFLAAPANTYLGMSNWGRFLQSDSASTTWGGVVSAENGSRASQPSFSLSGTRTLDLPVHSSLPSDSLATLLIRPLSDAVGARSELLRVFSSEAGKIEKIMMMPGVPVNAAPGIELKPFVSGLSAPVFMKHAGDGSGRLFIGEREGVIRIVEQGRLTSTLYLDVSSRVSLRGEGGLLGLAFHPDFSVNGRVFVSYYSKSNESVIEEYQASASNPSVLDSNPVGTILKFQQPVDNHNGGDIHFGPDGYLYIGFGDGGGSGDPGERAQDRSSLFGSILRVNIDGAVPYTIPADNPFVGVSGVREEIWAWGFRNPWRMSFDRMTGRLFLGDVGQNRFEEIDLVVKGGNYGWDDIEGFECFEPTTGCDRTNKIDPIAAYDHSEGASVIGGYMYRGSKYPTLYGRYIFADFTSGVIWSLEEMSDSSWKRTKLLDTGLFIASLAEDEAGELYVVDIGGSIFSLTDPLFSP